jgi:hypothetical protein
VVVEAREASAAEKAIMVRVDPVFRRSPFRARQAILLVATALLCGCAQSGGSEMRVDARANPASLIDSYLIARGMALSYGHSGRASPSDIVQLVHYDRAALVAVVTAQLEPGDLRKTQAEHALQALVNFTGDNDLRPDPVLPSGPPAAP